MSGYAGYEPTALDRAVDKAIAEENARYLAIPFAERDAEARLEAERTLWMLTLRHAYGLGPQMDAHVADLIARVRAEREARA